MRSSPLHKSIRIIPKNIILQFKKGADATNNTKDTQWEHCSRYQQLIDPLSMPKAANHMACRCNAKYRTSQNHCIKNILHFNPLKKFG